jgi:C1A family cysteine protease
MEYSTGGLRSPKDKRDITTERIERDGMVAGVSEHATSYMTDISMIPVYNQGKQPSCVAHAGATVKEYLDLLDTKTLTRYSKRFLYSLAKRNDGIPDVDGTWPRVAWQQLRSFGTVDETLVPDDITLSRTDYNTVQVNFELQKNAQPRVLKSFALVSPLTWDSLKNAIEDYKLVPILIALDNSFFHTVNGHLTPPATRLSGHEMFCYGYDEDHIYFRNSHGEEWGNKGNGDFGKDYMPFIEEAHVFVDLPNDYVESITKQISLLTQVVELYKKLIALKK